MNQLVAIEWLDSAAAVAGWKPLSECAETVAVVRSVGWVYRETGDIIVIVPHRIDEIQPSIPAQACGEMIIPIEPVVARYNLDDPTRKETTMPTERGRELDAAIAREVMGLKVVMEAYGPREENSGRTCRYYSSDANAARLVLAEIMQRGLKYDLIETLGSLLQCNIPSDGMWSERWEFLNATPEAIGLAALAVYRGGPRG